MKTPNGFMTEVEVAERLGVSLAGLRHWRYTRRGPSYLKLGARVLYTPEDLERFLAESRRELHPAARLQQIS